jgi:hypothetical protein
MTTLAWGALKTECTHTEPTHLPACLRKIEVVDFPAFIVVDDKGNDFFAVSPLIGSALLLYFPYNDLLNTGNIGKCRK